MKQLSPDAKMAIIKKAMNRGTTKIADIAALNNIGTSTLNKWIQSYKREAFPSEILCKSTLSKDQTTLNLEQKFKHIVGAEGLDDVQLGKYCRQNGLYSHQLNEWKTELMTPKDTGDNYLKIKAELSEMASKNKKLERELRRKDKALAEASALLILKKKADLIWGESEDD